MRLNRRWGPHRIAYHLGLARSRTGLSADLAADRTKTRSRRQGGPVGGYRYIHHAIDDYSRVVYSEILDDERKDTAAGFFQRANAFFKDLGVTVQAIMTSYKCGRPVHSLRPAMGPTTRLCSAS